MREELEQYDLNTLLSMYMEESKRFSAALKKGASWQELREKRVRIREINESINAKYQQQNAEQGRRRDDLPPHTAGK